MSKAKIAIIGIGNWGKNLLKEFKDQSEVVYVCHTGRESSIEFLNKEYPNIKQTQNIDDILNDASIDAVIVATPTKTHFDIAKKILESNKHLFLEKPGCSNKNELRELKNIADTKKLTVHIGYEFIYHPALTYIKEDLANKKINSIHLNWQKFGTFQELTETNLLPHEISIIKTLLKDSVVINNFKREKVITESDITYTEFYVSNIKIYSNINRVNTNKNKSVIVTSDEITYVWNNNNLQKINNETKEIEDITLQNQSPVFLEIEDFLIAINEKENTKSDLIFAIDIHELIDQLKSFY